MGFTRASFLSTSGSSDSEIVWLGILNSECHYGSAAMRNSMSGSFSGRMRRRYSTVVVVEEKGETRKAKGKKSLGLVLPTFPPGHDTLWTPYWWGI